MKSNPIKATHVYFEKQTETLSIKKSENKWYPINFQWIPVIKLKNELNLKTNKMKNLFFLPILVLLTFISSCSKDEVIIGSGNLTTETRDINYFSKVNSEGVFEVTITQGASQTLEITTDNNIINQVKTRVVNNELYLYLDDNYNYQDLTIQVDIIATNLNSLVNSGVGNMYAYEVDENGTFTIDNSGTGDILIEGSATNLNILNQGSGAILAFDFYVENCSIEIEGSGSAETSCSETLTVDIAGSGDVYYKGTPSINTTISGSGNIINSN